MQQLWHSYTVGNRSRQENQTSLRRNLDEIGLYLQDNFLKMNQSKTSITEIMIKQKKGKTPGQPPTLLVEKSPGVQKLVEDSLFTRILGANVQYNMAWQAHLETGTKALLPKIRRQLGMLRHQGKLIPMRSRRNLAQGLIVSRLSYLLPLWGGAPEAYLRKAQVVLNQTARWATGLGRKTRISALMEAAGMLTIKEQIKIATGVMTWKIVHLAKPARLNDRMTVDADYKILIERPRLMFSEECLRWRAATQWNGMRLEMRQETSLGKFKRQLRRQVLDERVRMSPPPD